MGCYYMLCHNTYAYSLLFYKVYIKRENAGSWDSGLEKEQILETYSAYSKSPETSRKSFSEYIKNTKRKKFQRGPSGDHLLLYGLFRWEKNHKPSFRTKLPHHKAEPWRNQSRAPAELFCRRNFPPGGGNHHQRSSLREGVNLHQQLHQHHLISKP